MTLVVDLKEFLDSAQKDAFREFRKRAANNLAFTHEDFGVCGVCLQSAAQVPPRIFYRNVVKFLDQVR
jgi:hypothetical protein